MKKSQYGDTYQDIISVQNLIEAWREFVSGKRKRLDVQEYESRLMDNILELHHSLAAKTYTHSEYRAFKISDPKPRDIHKASVQDRLLHHALYRKLYPFFDRIFIADSYSCRRNKGVHKALNRFSRFARSASRNNTRTAWVLKCDIRKFFASIDQEILKTVLSSYILDTDVLWLLERVIDSFQSTGKEKGLPLGNLTSQLLVNVYMNEFDQFVKHRLKAKHYIRYADDFVIFSSDRLWLEQRIAQIRSFLADRLKLTLHPKKVSIATFASGIDFLGWVHFPDHRLLRTSTKKRMCKALRADPSEETLASYRGLLSHGNTHTLARACVLPFTQ